MATKCKNNTIYVYQADIELQSKNMEIIHADIKYNELEGKYFEISLNGELQPIIINEEQLVQLLYACRKLKSLGSKGIDIFK